MNVAMASIRKEEIVQAVLIADTYDKRFSPIIKAASPVSIWRLYWKY